jgi:hypothetical protein
MSASKNALAVKHTPKLNWADASDSLCKYGSKCTNAQCRFEHTGRAPVKVKSKTMDGVVSAAGLVLSRKAELLRKANEFERKYVLVADQKDSKAGVENPYSDALKLCEVELTQLRQVARSIMGPMKTYKINLVENLSFSSAGSGASNGSATVDPSTLTEFGTLASLFDEYKVLGGEYRFSLMDWVPNTAAAMIAYGVLAYDPSDGTNPSTEISLAQKQQTMQVFYGTSVAGATGLTVSHPGGHVFKWKVPPGVLVPAGATASEGTSNWQPMTSSNGFQPYGWMKYCKQNVHSNLTQLSGINVYHCEFRSRE